MGAQGVQVATRFVPTKECDADENYKKEYIKAKKEDIVIVKSPVGMPGRAIKNKFMEKVINGEKFTPKKCLGCLARCNPKEIPYCITERLIYAAKGKTDEALLFCGADAYKVNKITTVKKVFKELHEKKKFKLIYFCIPNYFNEIILKVLFGSLHFELFYFKFLFENRLK